MKFFCIFHYFKNHSHFHHFKKSLHFSPRQVTNYNKITLKNHLYFSSLSKAFTFSTWASAITIRSLSKIFVFFSTLKNHSHFSPRQTTHYNKTTLKNYLYFSPGQVANNNLTILKFWILPTGRLLSATIPIQKFFSKIIFFFANHIFFLLSTLFSPRPSDNLLSSLFFSSECAFKTLLQTLLEGLIFFLFGESVISHSFFFFTKLTI